MERCVSGKFWIVCDQTWHCPLKTYFDTPSKSMSDALMIYWSEAKCNVLYLWEPTAFSPLDWCIDFWLELEAIDVKKYAKLSMRGISSLCLACSVSELWSSLYRASMSPSYCSPLFLGENASACCREANLLWFCWFVTKTRPGHISPQYNNTTITYNYIARKLTLFS